MNIFRLLPTLRCSPARDRAFLVFGVEDGSREKAGTTVWLKKLKKGGENFENWIARLMEPRLMIECLDFCCDGLDFAIIVIEPSYQRPVRFSGTESSVSEKTRKSSPHSDDVCSPASR